VRRGVLLNLLGWGVPAVAALLLVPQLLHGYGESRFGLLAIAWSTVGYLGLLDFGLSKALAQRVALLHGEGRQALTATSLRAALEVVLPIAVLGAVAGWMMSPWFMSSVLTVPAELQPEGTRALRLFALAVPATVLTAVFRGVLEGQRRFGTVTLLRVPFGLLTFVGPWWALRYGPSLVPAAAIIATGRWVLLLAHVAAVRSQAMAKAGTAMERRNERRTLATFGGWVTVSGVVSPLMNEIDRVGLGVLVPIAIVAHYAAAWEVVSKTWLITAALTPVLLPALAAARADGATELHLLRNGLRGLAVIVFPLLAVLVVAASPGLTWWLGAPMSLQATPVLRVLAVAMFGNVVAQVALTMLQARGRADLPAKFHLMELPVYVLMLWWLAGRYGAMGAALAWGARALVDAALLLWAAGAVAPETRDMWRRWGAISLGATLVLGALAFSAAPR
jgi:O-antigen/teichoic acid export membrane protein